MMGSADVSKINVSNISLEGMYQSSTFFVGIIYTGNEKELRDSLSSVLRQQKGGVSISIHLFTHAQNNWPKFTDEFCLSKLSFETKEEFFKLFTAGVSLCAADYCALLWSGEEFFEDAFTAVTSIFNQYKEINWLTGIQAYTTQNGFSVTLGSTAIRRWTYKIYERNLYKNSGRFIPPASTFWRKTIWAEVSPILHFVGQRDFCEDIWLAFFKTQKLYTCKIYFSSSVNSGRLNRQTFKRPNAPALIEDSWMGKMKEFFFINNIPYLRFFYKAEGGFAPIIRFDHNTQAYFLSEY